MSFLLKSAFWIGLVLLLLPIDTGPESADAPGLNPVRAFFAAQSTISDIGGFCDRNPDTCETGGQAIARIGAKAKVSARLIYEYLDEEEAAANSDSGLVTGGTDTLKAEDLIPGWTLPQHEGEAPEPRVADAAPANAAPVPLPPREGDVAVLPRPKPRGGDRPA
jgi:hypothetical protein|uniref:DUF5330 domain-containing protein n=1 Tax=Stappia sp. TaxID=1870903 RepID=UPI003BAB1718